MVSALDIIGSDKTLQEHWIKRVIAIVIDSIILYVIAGILLFLFFLEGGPLGWGSQAIWSLFSGLLLFLYSMVMEAMFDGATIGKRVLNLRVIATTGDMELGKSLIRNISKIHSLFLLLDFIVGFVTEGDPKQRWFDRAAGTTVVVTTELSEQEQHIYQSQQSKFAPPPQEPYPHTRHQQVYQYPPPTGAPAQKGPAPASGDIPGQETPCNACGGRMAETGSGRLRCIRCGKIQ